MLVLKRSSPSRVSSGSLPERPSVAVTTTTRCPWAAAEASVPPVRMTSSSGWAWKATMPRELLLRVAEVCRLLRLPVPYDTDVVRTAYAPRATITHRINVRPFARQKRDAFATHRSQIGTGTNARLFGTLLRLPPQVFGLVFSYEWFVDPAAPSGTLARNIFGAPA